MDKKEYFLLALKNGLYKKKHWVLTTFAESPYQEFDGGKDNYPYQIFLMAKDSKAIGFLNPETNQLEQIIDVDSSRQLFIQLEHITVGPDEVPYLKEKMTLTYGILLLNYILLVYPFGGKVPFVLEKNDGSLFEKEIKKRLADNPVDGEVLSSDKISVDEYINFQQALDYLGQFTQVFTPSGTFKSMTANPEVLKLRNKLVKEAGDRINDPVVLSEIQNQIAAADREALKDDPSAGYLLSKKSYGVTRMKLFYMYGLEGGFGEPKVITQSLTEGLDPDNIPSFANATREASYNRGKQTALGGVGVKRANQIFQAVTISELDCGYNAFGLDLIVDDTDSLIGRYLIVDKKPILITDESSKQYAGAKVLLRTPMLCKTAAPNYCEVCAGVHLSMVKDGIHVGIANVSSIIMYAFMGAMHGKALAVQYCDITTAWT